VAKAKIKTKKNLPLPAFPSHARLFASHLLNGTPPPVVRKSAEALSDDEQRVFKNAITKAIADGTYSRLVQIHADMNHDMHTMSQMPGSQGTMRFLPWHRLYLINFEQAMRSFEPTFAVPHWRWVDRAAIPAWLNSFTPSGVVDAQGGPILITRDPGGNPDVPSLPTLDDVQSNIMNQTEYLPFTLALEGAQPFGAHNQVHVWFNGTMSVVPTAPADPMFWMHHAEIDRIWAIWAAANPGQQPTLDGANATLDPWPETFKDVLSMQDGDYSYSYDDINL
jgi:tyrosinase